MLRNYFRFAELLIEWERRHTQREMKRITNRSFYSNKVFAKKLFVRRGLKLAGAIGFFLSDLQPKKIDCNCIYRRFFSFFSLTSLCCWLLFNNHRIEILTERERKEKFKQIWIWIIFFFLSCSTTKQTTDNGDSSSVFEALD